MMTEHEVQYNLLDEENAELNETVAIHKSRCIALKGLVKKLQSKKYMDKKVQERLLAKGMTRSQAKFYTIVMIHIQTFQNAELN